MVPDALSGGPDLGASCNRDIRTRRAAGPASRLSTSLAARVLVGGSSSTRRWVCASRTRSASHIPSNDTKSTTASAACLYLLDADPRALGLRGRVRPPPGRICWAKPGAWSCGARCCSTGSSPRPPHRVPAQRRDHSLAFVRCWPPDRPQPVGKHRRRPRPHERGVVHGSHDRPPARASSRSRSGSRPPAWPARGSSPSCSVDVHGIR